MAEKTQKQSPGGSFFEMKEISGIGRAGTVRLLRGGFARLLARIGNSLSYASTRAYGAFFLSFGLLTLLLNLGEYYFVDEPSVPLSSLVAGVALTLFAIPLLAFNRPMCIALQDFPVTDKIFFDFFSIKRMSRITQATPAHPAIFLFFGIACSVVGFLIPVEYVILALSVFVFVIIAFITPEFPMIFTILALPYVTYIPHADIILIVLSSVTFLSYALKVIIGKRTYNLDVYGILIFIMLSFVFISGITGIGADSFKNSLVFILLSLGYFPISNLVVNKRLAQCVRNAVVVSAVPITLLSIIEFIVELPSSTYPVPSYSTPGVSVLFSTPAALAAFMLVCAVITLSFAIEHKNPAQKLFYLSIFFLEIVTVTLTMQPMAWLSALLCILAYFILSSKSIHSLSITVLLVAAHLVLLLPASLLGKISDLTGMTPSFLQIILGYNAGLGVWLENIWLGIGAGAEGFFAASGGADANFGTLLGIGVEFGIVALIFFLSVIFIRLVHFSKYSLYLRTSPLLVDGKMATLSVLALLFFGAGIYIFNEPSLAYIFWCMLGISSASLTVSKREYDEMHDYYGDFSSHDSSSIDVLIR